MALGWPVSENGPAPGLPIWPVARCRLISAAFLAVPLLDWFRPWQYRLSVAGEVANHARGAVNQVFLLLIAAGLRHQVGRAVAHRGFQRVKAGGVGAM
jgi:threonine/homoserine efflux transporter RhtA